MSQQPQGQDSDAPRFLYSPVAEGNNAAKM